MMMKWWKEEDEMDKLGDIMKTLEVQDNNITEDEVRKFVSQYVKA